MKRGIIINPELKIVAVICFFIVLAGLVVFFISDSASVQKFNFHSSSIIVDGNFVKEKLEYKPDKDYHTLYRTFSSKVFWEGGDTSDSENSIFFINVECSSGTPYLRDFGGKCFNAEGIFNCPAYTENNEYGCTYGNNLGFKEGAEYFMESEFVLNPDNLFSIDGKYYIKFVAYSPHNHIKLTKKNFFVEGNAVKNKKYLPDENVIIYVLYDGDISGYKIVDSTDFEFDSKSNLLLIFYIILSIFPGIFFFLMWYFYGMEKSYEEIPRELSTFPDKRKFWEVAVYFNSPILKTGGNFFSSILLNFYDKGVIDIKKKDDEIFVKLNSFKGDDTEKKVYDILAEIYKNLKKHKRNKIIDGDYFNLKKAMRGYPGLEVYKKFAELQEDIKDEGKEYVKDNTAPITILSFLFLGMGIFVPVLFSFFQIIFVYFAALFLISIFLRSGGSIFMKFKKDYYVEYQKWKSFKRYLKNSFTIKTATHRTIVMWKEYLIYATSLGVPEKVLDELRLHNIIDSEQKDFYIGLSTGTYFGFNSSGGMSSGGFSAGGGGFGGAGGGGIGGGGGGGR